LYAGTHPGARLGELDLDELRRRQRITRMNLSDGTMTIAGSHGALRGDFDEALRLIQNGQNGSWRLVTALSRIIRRRVSLTDAPEFLVESARNGLLGKTLITV
jgi:hypothetical protein